MPDFNALLDKPLDNFEAPKPLPMGSYVFKITDYKYDKTSQKKTDFVRFTCVPVEPGPDVDEGELGEAGGLTGSDGQPKTIRLDFYLTPDALFRFKDFARDAIGIAQGTPVREAIEACKGETFMGMVTHRSGNNNTIYAEIGQTVKAG